MASVGRWLQGEMRGVFVDGNCATLDGWKQYPKIRRVCAIVHSRNVVKLLSAALKLEQGGQYDLEDLLPAPVQDPKPDGYSPVFAGRAGSFGWESAPGLPLGEPPQVGVVKMDLDGPDGTMLRAVLRSVQAQVLFLEHYGLPPPFAMMSERGTETSLSFLVDVAWQEGYGLYRASGQNAIFLRKDLFRYVTGGPRDEFACYEKSCSSNMVEPAASRRVGIDDAFFYELFYGDVDAYTQAADLRARYEAAGSYAGFGLYVADPRHSPRGGQE